MRQNRQNSIIELIQSHDISTQEQLTELLKSEGFDITQATVSRDIKELGLYKTLTPSGKYKYAINMDSKTILGDPFNKIFKETVKSVTSTGNLVILKTLSGCGPAAGEAIDSMGLKNVAGSIAGDNTIFLAIVDGSPTEDIVKHFQSLLI